MRRASTYPNTWSYSRDTHTIFWDPRSALRCLSGGTQSPALGLGHEMAHADRGFWDALIGGISSSAYDNLEEKRVITGPETTAARNLGAGIRTDHRGTPHHVAS